MSTRTNWILGVSLALFMTLTPLVYYRYNYTTNKRVRVVTEGKLYRSGCLTVDGFEDVVRRYGVRTIVNLQEEAPDPNIPAGYISRASVRESELCKRLGVKYEFLEVDYLPPNANEPPKAIAKFQEIMDHPETYPQPVLVHCRAGLHRTGVLVAMYRMEYDGWSAYKALTELRSLGFGRIPSYAPNEYIRQYVVDYQPRTPHASTQGTLTSRTKQSD